MAENNAILSESEKGRILFHLGYGIVNVADLFTLGVPAISQPLYIAASAINRIPESRLQLVREIVAELDAILGQFKEAREYFPATSLGELDVNPDHTKRLEEEQVRWTQMLSDCLIAPVNPFSGKFNRRSQAINARVRAT